MPHKDLRADLIDYVLSRAGGPEGPPRAQDVTRYLGVSRPTVNRLLRDLLNGDKLRKVGAGPQTRYVPGSSATELPGALPQATSPPAIRATQALKDMLTKPLGSRVPVTYDREFVDDYVPNQTCLVPAFIADSLYRAGRAQGQQPAGTVARKVLEQLLIDLSWYSSRLEGNRRSLLDTQELFARGRGDASDLDVTMLLNHKEAIEFMVDAVPEEGITVPVVRNLHALLMQGLLPDETAAGKIRRRIVNIDGSVYQPLQVPSLLEELLNEIVTKARLVRNPIEAAFFLWANVAYLQPFEDGNKRTSRLCANLPLLLHNCAPLSFLEVEAPEYTLAMLGVYEQRNVDLAVEVFETTYRRSIDKYRVALSSMGTPDPVRARYREQLGDVVRQVVGNREPLSQSIQSIGLFGQDLEDFTRLVREELAHLEIYNCARYRLSIPVVERWISAGRPGAEA